MLLPDGIQSGDRARITIQDPDSGDTAALIVTIIAVSPVGLLVRPDDPIVELLTIDPHELIALERLTSA